MSDNVSGREDQQRQTATTARPARLWVSDKMDKTVVVRLSRSRQARALRQKVMPPQPVKAHDEQNTAGVGDRVISWRPAPAPKRWRVVEILEKPGCDTERSEGVQPRAQRAWLQCNIDRRCGPSDARAAAQPPERPEVGCESSRNPGSRSPTHAGAKETLCSRVPSVARPALRRASATSSSLRSRTPDPRRSSRQEGRCRQGSRRPHDEAIAPVAPTAATSASATNAAVIPQETMATSWRAHLQARSGANWPREPDLRSIISPLATDLRTTAKMAKIKKGDYRPGAHRQGPGQAGKVIAADTETQRVTVEGVNRSPATSSRAQAAPVALSCREAPFT